MGNHEDIEKVNKFLKDLSKISKKHGILIGGCGCCNSPYLDDLNIVKKDMEKYCFDFYSGESEIMWDGEKYHYGKKPSTK